MTASPGTGDPTLRLTGDIDMATADDVAVQGIALLAESGPGSTLLIDLGEVTFVDSSGLSALVRLRRAAVAQESQIRLRDVPHRVQVLLDVSGLSEYFPVA